MKRLPLLVVLAAVAVFAVPAHALTIGGLTFDDNAGVDSILASQGSYRNNSNGTFGGLLTDTQLAAVLTDSDARTYAYTWDSPAYLKLGFTNNVLVNGAGADLALFDLGVGATFPVSLTVGGTTLSFTTTSVGTVNTPEGALYGLNLALIDLSDFGIASGSSITSFVVGMDAGDTPPSLGFAGALNSGSTSVPEPSALLLIGTGLVGLFACGRKGFTK